MKTFITIQHPQSIHHTNGMVGSWTDWDLSELGIKQAHNIAKNLSKEVNDNFVIYSSDLLRAKHTADIIGEYLNIKPVYMHQLRERYLGKACGKTVAWLRENKENEEYTVYNKIFSDCQSRKEVYDILKPFVDQIIQSHDNIIIVSHGDLLSIFNIIFLNLDIEVMNNISLNGYSGGVSKMIIDDNGYRKIHCLSNMSYLL